MFWWHNLSELAIRCKGKKKKNDFHLAVVRIHCTRNPSIDAIKIHRGRIKRTRSKIDEGNSLNIPFQNCRKYTLCILFTGITFYNIYLGWWNNTLRLMNILILKSSSCPRYSLSLINVAILYPLEDFCGHRWLEIVSSIICIELPYK